MKNILTKSMIALSLVTVFFSCKKKEITPADVPTYAAPVITFINGITSHQLTLPDFSDTIYGNTTSENKLKEVSFSIISNGGEKAFGSAITTFSNTSSYDFKSVINSASLESAGVILDAGDKANGITLKVTVTDLKALVTTSNFTLTFTQKPGEINTYTATILGGNSNMSLGSYYASSNNTVYLSAEAKNNSALVDMVYYYGSSNLATLSAPNDPTVNGGPNNFDLCTSFSTKNKTFFGTTAISTSNFDAITNDAALVGITGITSTNAPSLVIGKVISFRTAAGKIGLIKVTDIVTGGSGSITITVKVQK